MENSSDIRLAAITSRGIVGAVLRLIGPAADRLLGVRRLRRIYERNGMAGLEKHAFIDRFKRVLKIECGLDPGQLASVPQEGPAVLIANHPLGGLEGILLASILKAVRPDYKIFANVMLSFISELRDFFIFTNPVLKGGRENYDSISQASRWLRDGHLLLVFPAGRVGIYRAEKGYVTDERWDMIALSLGLKANAAFIPLFVGGECSKTFSLMSRFIYPMKLLMLVREFISSFSKRVDFSIGRPVDIQRLQTMRKRHANAYLRMRSYLLAPLKSPAAIARDKAATAKGVISSSEKLLAVSDQENDEAIAECRLSKTGESWELSGLSCAAKDAEKAAGILWRQLEEFRPLSGSIPLVPLSGSAYCPHSVELIKAALTRENAPRHGAREKRGDERLHPEVLDYIERYGMEDGELGEIVAALEGSEKPLPFMLSRLRKSKALFRIDRADPLTIRFFL
jgi:putative hemolysin